MYISYDSDGEGTHVTASILRQQFFENIEKIETSLESFEKIEIFEKIEN